MAKKLCKYYVIFCSMFFALAANNHSCAATLNAANSGIYVDEEITTPITKIAAPNSENQIKDAKINFNSPTFLADLKSYMNRNIEFPKDNVVSFSFSYTKQGVIADIHLSSISGDDYHDGNDYYAARIYGDVCKRDGLKENQIYITQNSRTADLTIDTINNTNDGKYLVKLYDSIKKIGKSHSILIPPYDSESEFSSICGMYYQGNLYINKCSK